MDKAEALRTLKIDRGAEDARSGGWARRILVVAALVLLAAGGFAAWIFLVPRALAVETATVEVSGGVSSASAGSAGSVLNASGYVVAELATTVSSQVTGMIRKVLVNEGMRVGKGQVLAYLDDSQAKAGVDSADSQLQAQRAAAAEAAARLAQDELALDRVRRLIDRQLASRMDFDNAQAAVTIDQATLRQAQSRVAVAKSSLAAARINLDYTIIRAPFAGVITEKYAHPGEMISPAAVGGFTKTGVCQLVDMDSLEIDVDVNEAFIQRVQKDMRVEAVLDAYPDWRIPAHVINVVPTANRQKATVRVRIAFDQLDPRIVPEMGVQVWFYGSGGASEPRAPASVLVPAEAVRGNDAQHYVFLIKNDRAVRQDVTVGSSRSGKIKVWSGLAGGERVITASPAPLKGGERVAPRRS
jgi:RND family efflux transporter MFP subunit